LNFRKVNFRSPTVSVVIGVGATVVVALVVVIALLRTGGTKAVSDNAALIGALVALGGVFTTQLVNIALEDRRTKKSRDFEAERAQDSALQAFLDQISHSDTYRELRTAAASGHKRAVLRAKLQTLLLQLDGKRKGVLLSFLHGGMLIRKKAITPYEYTKEGVKLKYTKEGAKLEPWKYPILRLNDIDLSQTELNPHTKLTFDDLRGTILRGAKLSKVNLSGANLSGADLREADLSGAHLRKATPQDSEEIPGEHHNEYRKALDKADKLPPGLLETDLSGADLSGADLSGANLIEAYLYGANLIEAYLYGANLSGANLQDAKELTQDQIKWTIGSSETDLPEGLDRPELWDKSVDEQRKILQEHLSGAD
jgi:hypothetical protein